LRFLILSIVIFIAKISFAQERDSLTVPYTIIDSDPQNADVLINDSYEGKTPWRLLLKNDTVLNVRIRLKGYFDYAFTLNRGDQPKTVKLIRNTGSNFTADKKLVDPGGVRYFSKPRKIIPIVLSALVTVGAGISAYYYKSLSIEKSDEYDITGDPHVLDNKNKYDVIGGVSMVVFQLGLISLLYFLFENY
jgi:hypothetical protein